MLVRGANTVKNRIAHQKQAKNTPAIPTLVHLPFM
jgi:hypothetical protein